MGALLKQSIDKPISRVNSQCHTYLLRMIVKNHRENPETASGHFPSLTSIGYEYPDFKVGMNFFSILFTHSYLSSAPEAAYHHRQ